MNLALYLHIPFCLTKCHYCAFNSVVASLQLQHDYLRAMQQEISNYSHMSRTALANISSLYIGGGTPTIVDVNELTLVIEHLRRCFCVAENVEFSCEANPRTVDRSKVSALQQAGVNRISLGVQSFDDGLLNSIGRHHTAADAKAAISLLRAVGFNNLNLDLIFGLPGQSASVFFDSLKMAIEEHPEHVSLYGLQLEEGTPLAEMVARGKAFLPEEEEQVEMYFGGKEMLEAAGFRHYEISNFALPGYECRHNLTYWQHQEYLGFGAGAFSYLDKKRFSNSADPIAYTSSCLNLERPGGECEIITPQIEEAESLILGFRMVDGIDIPRINERFAIDFMVKYHQQVEVLLHRGLLEICGTRLRPTKQGLILNNQIAMEFV